MRGVATSTAHRAAHARPRVLRLPSVPADERFNVATALLGLLGVALAGAWLVARAESPTARASLGFYGASHALMFAATAAHHAWPLSDALRRLDHASIHLAILGASAPVCLLLAPGPVGTACLGLVAALCAAGVALKLAGPPARPWPSLGLYLAAPSPLLAVIAASWAALPWAGAAALAGAAATLVGGAVMEAAERPAVPRIGAHGAFHLCVLAGCALVALFLAAAVPPG